MGGRRWTPKEDRALLDGVGTFALNWFRKKSGKTHVYPNSPDRTRKAIYYRAGIVNGKGGLTRGTYTLRQATTDTGYAKEQLQRAQSALGQKWKRLSRRGSFMITLEQLEEMCEWLKQDYWCKKLRLYSCVNCGSNRHASRGQGLCKKCYFKIRRLAKSLRLPDRVDSLIELIMSSLDSTPQEVRGFLENARRQLERGWALTENQIRQLASISS